jgi:hypothetical protein
MPVSASHIRSDRRFQTQWHIVQEILPSLFAGGHCRHKPTAIMSTILSILRAFKEEIERISEVPDDVFSQYIGTISDIRPSELSFLWRVLEDERQQCILFEELSPVVVSEALDRLPDDERIRALIDMSDGRRLSIVETWTRQKENRQLNELERWQDPYEQGLIPRKFVVTDTMPPRYPVSVDTCFYCNRYHQVWSGVFSLFCTEQHTACENCHHEQRAPHRWICQPSSQSNNNQANQSERSGSHWRDLHRSLA